MPLRSRKSLLVHPALILASLAANAAAQATQQPAAPAPQLQQRTEPPAGATVLRQSSQLVILDVVVQDRAGNPVHGLKREDFLVKEVKNPQTIRNFEAFNSAQPPAHPLQMPHLPPGQFTDYSPVATGGPLNILLLDTLNTPMADQSFVRSQLQQYVKHAQPGIRIAIFGLTSHLTLLQGFTANPEILKNAVEHKLIPRSSVVLDDPAAGIANLSLSSALDDMGVVQSTEAAANLAQFEAETKGFQLDLRVRYTIDAFHNLGKYLSAFPGRKNIMWFSGSFPLSVMPDKDLTDPFGPQADYSAELRDTTGLLTRAQVAIYPIDARGLMNNPAFSAAQSGGGFTRHADAMGNAIAQFSQSQIAEHMTMDQMAEDTGGHAFYNTNGLWQAVTKAIDAGSNYYTLTYTPTDKKDNGEYRDIRVELVGAAAANGYKLAYRHGYFAPDARHPTQDLDTSDSHAAQAYAYNAMDRGAPEPADIIFKAQVLPASLSTETKLADGNQGPPGGLTGPFRRYDVDIFTLGNSFHVDHQPDGRWTGKISFNVFVYDNQGKLLNVAGNTIGLNLTEEMHQAFLKHPLAMHFEVSVPVRAEAYLRIGVHDFPTNRFGVVEIPVASVERLSPAVYPSQPASTTSTSTTAPAPAKPSPPTPAPAQPAPNTSR